MKNITKLKKQIDAMNKEMQDSKRNLDLEARLISADEETDTYTVGLYGRKEVYPIGMYYIGVRDGTVDVVQYYFKHQTFGDAEKFTDTVKGCFFR